MSSEHPIGPHADQLVQTRGPDLADAEQAVILLHGRCATADSILQPVDSLPQDGIAYLAPQAADREWYPHAFLEPVERNEPHLTSALNRVSRIIETVNDAGITPNHTFIAGFSQGACLALEYAARHPQRYGGVVGFSGGLIGEQVDPQDYSGDMEQTPVFLGCSDQDPHIPLERVNATADVFASLNAAVEKRIYKGMGHTVNQDELAYVRELLNE